MNERKNALQTFLYDTGDRDRPRKINLKQTRKGIIKDTQTEDDKLKEGKETHTNPGRQT